MYFVSPGVYIYCDLTVRMILFSGVWQSSVRLQQGHQSSANRTSPRRQQRARAGLRVFLMLDSFCYIALDASLKEFVLVAI